MNNKHTSAQVRAHIVTLLQMKKAAVPVKAAWIEQRIDIALKSLMNGQVGAAYVTANAAVRDCQ